MAPVTVFGVWASPFGKRVEIALKSKGIEYEFIEEDLSNKSEELLKYNPVHKKVPVLVHNGKPVVESLVILEYIDETWKENPILPSDTYERARIRFWANFIDEKIIPSFRAASFIQFQGKDSKKATQDLEDNLMILENEVTNNKNFGGDKIGFLDIVGLFVVHWIPTTLGKNFLSKDKFPQINGWADKLMQNDIIKKNLPDEKILLPYIQSRLRAVVASLATPK